MELLSPSFLPLEVGRMDFLARQNLLFDSKEQELINDLTIFVVGAGGLGTHQSLQLQRIGVKKLYLVDYDKIELSNLNRQILYGREDIGEEKVAVAQKKLAGFDLGTEIVACSQKITESTEIPADVDLVLDALDNFKSRFLLEKLAREAELPFIHGGIDGWFGQVTTILPEQEKGLKDIYGSELSSEGKIATFSPVVSTIANFQVLEAVKVALGYDEILTEQLLMIDLRNGSLDKIEL